MNSPLIGILGGMGPLASSAFTHFLYKKCHKKFQNEQNFPRIILISDPTVPDRMSCVSNNEEEKVITFLENKIQELLFLGATHIMICCFTAHYFVKSLSLNNPINFIHLGSAIENYLNLNQKTTLIFCSKLLAQSKLICSQYAIYPEEKHFSKIHDLIYKIKLNGPFKYKNALLTFAQTLAKSYQVNRVLFGCTEFHLVYQILEKEDEESPVQFLDGLNIAANFMISLFSNPHIKSFKS